jgi:hypothetical protein
VLGVISHTTWASSYSPKIGLLPSSPHNAIYQNVWTIIAEKKKFLLHFEMGKGMAYYKKVS